MTPTDANLKVVSNVEVFGLEKAATAARYPMTSDIRVLSATEEDFNVADKLANTPAGTGHDNFLNGVVVQFDLTFTNKAWVEAERYHFLDFVSSQSTMHCITKFNLDNAYIHYTDPRIVSIMKDKVLCYNAKKFNRDHDKCEGLDTTELDREIKQLYLEILYSNPAGFRLTARMTTNYRQLKTIYAQRLTHRLPEWRLFCKWIESLPHSEWITGRRTK